MFKKILTQNFLYAFIFALFIIFLILASISIWPLPRSLDQFSDAINSYDAQNYLDICHKGYNYSEQPYPASILRFSFYPALPALDCIGVAMQIDLFPVYLNIILFMYLAYSLEKYLKLHYTEPKERNYIFWTYLCFPFAFFFHLNYTEALFIGLTFHSLYFIEKKEILKSSFVGLIIGFVRPTALFLAFSLWVRYLTVFFKESKLTIKNFVIFLRNSLGFISFGIGTVALFIMYKVFYGDFFLFFESEDKFYGRKSSLGFIKNLFEDLSGKQKWYEQSIDYLNKNVFHFDFYNHYTSLGFLIYFPLIIIIVSTIYMLIHKKWYYLFFSWFMFILPLTQDTVSLNRYILQSFPFIFMFSELCFKNKISRTLLPVIYIIGFVLCVILYTHSYWIG